MIVKPQFFSHLRFGLIALGVVAGVCGPVAAAPLAPALNRSAILPAVAEGGPDTLLVHSRRYSGCYRYGRCYGRSQLNYRYRNDDWRYRQYRPYRRHYRPYGPQLYLGLGVPTYRYVQPRRYYRQRLGSAHVAWCYDRWRSYRAWDNTYQPYYGPRRQCWSPYSG